MGHDYGNIRVVEFSNGGLNISASALFSISQKYGGRGMTHWPPYFRRPHYVRKISRSFLFKARPFVYEDFLESILSENRGGYIQKGSYNNELGRSEGNCVP